MKTTIPPCQAPAKLGKPRFSGVSEENRLGVAGNVSFPAKTGCKTYAKLGKTANHHPQGGELSKSLVSA